MEVFRLSWRVALFPPRPNGKFLKGLSCSRVALLPPRLNGKF